MRDSRFLNSQAEICECLGVGRTMFKRLVAEGLPVVKIGKSYRSHKTSLLVWWKERLVNIESNEGGS